MLSDESGESEAGRQKAGTPTALAVARPWGLCRGCSIRQQVMPSDERGKSDAGRIGLVVTDIFLYIC